MDFKPPRKLQRTESGKICQDTNENAVPMLTLEDLLEEIIDLKEAVLDALSLLTTQEQEDLSE